jgi:hypothetical protein
MHDTTPAAEAQLRALYAARSPAERLRMATAMFGTATRVTLAGLRHEDPQREGVALRLALLERLHGDDLTPSIRAAVAAYDPGGADHR